jgi:hypothetical protein
MRKGIDLCLAVSFYALLKDHPWRLWAQALMWVGVAATGYYYWP